MTHIRYNIVHRNGGWRIACGNVLGPPYFRKQEAISDVNFIAESLRKTGEDVQVVVEELDAKH